MSSLNFRARLHSGATLLGLLCMLFGSAHAADSEQLAQLESRLDNSLKLIEQLTARVRELEARSNTAQTSSSAVTAQTEQAAPATADANERLVSVEREIAQIAAGNAGRHDGAGLPVHGFADVGAGTRNAVNSNLHGAAVGSVDFYLTPQLGERTKALVELNFEVGDTGELAVDLERAQLGYQFADAVTVWLGRFHTPYGYYNTAFHHGHQIANSLRRPRFLQFEDQGGILPAHTVGLWLTGARRTSAGKLTYDLYVGNAQRVVNGTIDMNTAGGPHGGAMIGGNVGLLLGESLPGLKIGANVFRVEVENDNDLIAAARTRVNNYGLYAVYDTDRWENIAEYYLFDNTDLSGTSGKHQSEAGFVQLGYRTGRLIPYARYERAALEQGDNFFAAQQFGGSYYREALGVRFDLDLSSALKLELAQTHLTDRAREQYSEALMQYAIRF